MTDTHQEFRAHLFFKAGLYEKVPFAPDIGGVWAVGARNDGMCLPCRRDSTLVIAEPRVVVHNNGPLTEWPGSPAFRSGIHVIELTCSRNRDHLLVFAVLNGKGWMMKIGQWPSIADIGLGELRRFDRILGDTDRKELATAIGLHAHGVGVGSFVYLRRILERLIREAEARVGAPENSQARIVDRIKALKGEIPEFLTQTPNLYGLLSVDIHELAEDDCLAAFPVVASAINEIIEEKLAAKLRTEARERTRRELDALGKKHSRDVGGADAS